MPPRVVNLVKRFRLFDFITADEAAAAAAEEEEGPAPPRHFVIRMFGVNERGETCAITVTDFRPFFYIKVSDDWHPAGNRAFVKWLVKGAGIPENRAERAAEEITATVVEQKKLYGFDAGRLYKFVKLEFNTTGMMNRVRNYWYDRDRHMVRRAYHGIPLQIYESGIPPLLRFFHIKNISPSGWIQIPVRSAAASGRTTCNYEYVCPLATIQPLPDKETLVPFKICSFDIEASSSHGDFPLPKKTYKRLAAHIVDSLAGEESPLTAAARMRAEILAAFGFIEDPLAELVYPKSAPTEAQIKALNKGLLHYKLDLNRGVAIDANTIESMFGAAAVDDEGGAGAPAGDDDEPAAVAAAAAEVDTDDDSAGAAAAPAAPKKRVIRRAAAVAAPEVTIIDYILDRGETRDDKIALLNDLMTNTIKYPPLEGDKVTFIGSTFLYYGEKEPYRNHCFCLGSCDPVAGADIESVDTEEELLLGWKNLIQTENPDIIIGYNIFGFDWDFMFHRAQENHCVEDFLELSRVVGEVCAKRDFESGRIECLENTKVVLASGEYDLKYVKMSGRLQIDLYTYFRRDYNLASYKLDDVAGQFIGDSIAAVTHEADAAGRAVTRISTKNKMGIHVGDYIHLEESGFTTDYYGGGAKFEVLALDADSITIGGHHTLDATKSLRWGLAKDDVSPQDIFRLSREGPAARARVAKYCIQDCNLVHHLMNKIDVLTGYVEMSRICSVPISFLVFRGQGIKLTSYVAKKCREKDTLMPDLEKSRGNEAYEGAIVLPPKCAMYMDNPVACVDYASLYPSSMISENLSHDSKVWTKEYDLEGNLVAVTGVRDAAGNFIYDNLPDYEYIDTEFDTYRWHKNARGTLEKTRAGRMVCRWAQFPDGRKGIMPAILEELLRARADTRKAAKKETDPFMANILDKRQLGYKVTANSLYGQTGAKTSTFYEKDIAASTTATGRKMITYAKRIIEEVYGNTEVETAEHGLVMTAAEYVYGDSVAAYTPLAVRAAGGGLRFMTAEQLAAEFAGSGWQICTEIGRQTKEVYRFAEPRPESWTERGWTPISTVIRHRLADHKKMISVTTTHGIVDVTDDHSLLRPSGREISPAAAKVGTTLMQRRLPAAAAADIADRLARIHGMFAAAGAMGSAGGEPVWLIKHTDIAVLESYKELLMSRYPDIAWKIHEGPTGRHILSHTTRAHELFLADFTPAAMDAVLGAPRGAMLSFLEGFLDAGGKTRCQLLAAKVSYILTQLDKANMIRRTGRDYFIDSCDATTDSPATITDLCEIPHYYGYVYDLTTTNHHFAAGIGSLIVHNTDSVFFTFNLKDRNGADIRGRKALEITIEIAQEVAHLCTKFLKAPMELAYEKTLMPFILLSKKRYVGMLYETNPNKGKLKYMGLSIKRRDSCDYLKDTYGDIITYLMSGRNIQDVLAFLEGKMNNLIEEKVPMDKLAITRSLRSDYKNPAQIAHRVLADRIARRDPGNRPKAGDRMKFLFINGPPRALMGERIETPEFIVANNVKIDYGHYITNQLMKPLQQLLGLALKDIVGAKRSVLRRIEREIAAIERECAGDLELFMKKREQYCSKEVKKMVFDGILTRLQNEKNGNRMITDCFARKR